VAIAAPGYNGPWRPSAPL